MTYREALDYATYHWLESEIAVCAEYPHEEQAIPEIAEEVNAFRARFGLPALTVQNTTIVEAGNYGTPTAGGTDRQREDSRVVVGMVGRVRRGARVFGSWLRERAHVTRAND